ncbi:DUF2652 domain-containing protein [Seonamhaeicola maritimus]|uniref:DUF2652 domain-containing protein n=1 Tax=Seonamhaeicola maritimus TaxID=2591822 RepID=UPI0024942960|nr:DUF2652 domain-containing protein [Seonamhaeicola maritimus]
MTQNAILFIPDISGFTEFVHHTDISHSRHIISELLELLIDSNTMGLELAEIEGDALFLYKLEEEVNVTTIEKQIEAMYLAFHSHLKRYEYQRICHCGACSSAYNLKIKFVVHYGEIEFIQIKDSKKPYGSNVIQVHRLLKNDVPIDEYAIFTESVKALDENSQKLKANYDFGEIVFTFNQLSHLKEILPEIDPIPKDVPKTCLLKETLEVKISALELYEILSNFDYRLLWVKGINKLEYDKNKVNRAGLKHKCLVNNQEIDQTTVTKDVNKNQLVYGESTTNFPFTKRMSNYFVLEEKETDLTQVDIELFADFKPFGIIMKPLLKKKLKKAILENFNYLISLIDSGFTFKSDAEN